MTTGLVLDIGDGVTHVVPAFEGYALPYAIQKINLAGRDVTNYLKNLLLFQGVKLVTTSEFEICRDIKEKVCYVASDFSVESNKTDHELMTCYEMPDGHVVNISSARFQAPEVFFSPEIRGLDILSVQSAVYTSILHSDIDVRRHLYENIILSGGSTMFSGFPLRLLNEIKGISKTSAKINVLANKERKFSV